MKNGGEGNFDLHLQEACNLFPAYRHPADKTPASSLTINHLPLIINH